MYLKMNIAKTKMMVVDNTPINVNNVLIENVEGYVYLPHERRYLDQKINSLRASLYATDDW